MLGGYGAGFFPLSFYFWLLDHETWVVLGFEHLFYFRTGLTLDLFINQMEYIPSLSQEAGVRVLLTPQRNIPFPVDEGFTLSPGFATYIGLRQVCLP